MVRPFAKALGVFVCAVMPCASEAAPAAAITPVAGSPFAFSTAENSNTTAISPDRRFLFVGNQGSSTITVLDVAADGSLTFHGVHPTLMAPSGMVTDPAGLHLYVSGFDTRFVDAFDIGADGSLTNRRSTALGFFSEAANAIAYMQHPAGADFVYVNNNLGFGNSVSAFAVQPDGSLVAIGNYLTGGDGGGGFFGAPHLVFARLDRLYALNQNQNSNTVTVFNVAADGTLMRAGSPFALGISSSGALAITPAGDALFAGDFGGAITRYPIAADGSLGPGQSTHSGVNGAVDGLEVHPNGTLLVAAFPN